MDDGKMKNISDRLANERTILAWIRTCIGIMAFGFVVVKFSLFVKQLGLLLGKRPEIQQKGYSSVMGIALVAFGTIISLLAYIRYKKTEKEILIDSYEGSSLLISFLAGFIFLISMLLLAYLLKST
jgi:putative membrane protein